MPERTSPIVETAVVARKTMGQSNTQIGKELDIDRATVASILDRSGFSQAIEYGMVRVHRLIPKACDAIEKELDEGNGTLGFKLLQGAKVIESETSQGVTAIQIVTNITLPD